jgi:putative membrane protein
MYNFAKIIHVLAIISWMAAMLYLPRLFVYHAGLEKGSNSSQLFKVMERRLAKAIMTPAMIAAWISGLWLAYEAGFFRAGWFHAKLALVVVMSGVHGLLIARLRAFADDRNQKSGVYYRVLNEVPTVLMIGIVTLVIAKPF